ncbi:MAG: TetR/AcrR family transcriptional regulator [Ilumatobacteraceae bacterium]|nr:TetR/AcrR family transcriptional regulator [Ilumatobacteraceae bacterium]
MSGGHRRALSSAERRVLDAVRSCCERWGIEKVTVDDIARESGVSRATLYRLFPGGKDVMFDALRVREIDEFFAELEGHLADAVDLEDLLVRAITASTAALRDNEHLAIMMATEPGTIVSELTVEGLPRIISMATDSVLQYVERFVTVEQARPVIDLVVRLVISFFLSPSPDLDLADPASARTYMTPLIDAAVSAARAGTSN